MTTHIIKRASRSVVRQVSGVRFLLLYARSLALFRKLGFSGVPFLANVSRFRPKMKKTTFGALTKMCTAPRRNTIFCKMKPRWPKMAPRWPQDGPKMAQDGIKMAPRWPQDGPKMAQDGPKMAQDGPKMAQDDPRWPQDRPKRAPRWIPDGRWTSKNIDFP